VDSFVYEDDNKTYVPLRFLAEAMGGNVVWDRVNNTATITVPAVASENGAANSRAGSRSLSLSENREIASVPETSTQTASDGSRSVTAGGFTPPAGYAAPLPPGQFGFRDRFNAGMGMNGNSFSRSGENYGAQYNRSQNRLQSRSQNNTQNNNIRNSRALRDANAPTAAPPIGNAAAENQRRTREATPGAADQPATREATPGAADQPATREATPDATRTDVNNTTDIDPQLTPEENNEPSTNQYRVPNENGSGSLFRMPGALKDAQPGEILK
jgi:hypothetical protein